VAVTATAALRRQFLDDDLDEPPQLDLIHARIR
jgi:hypothetical protein